MQCEASAEPGLLVPSPRSHEFTASTAALHRVEEARSGPRHLLTPAKMKGSQLQPLQRQREEQAHQITWKPEAFFNLRSNTSNVRSLRQRRSAPCPVIFSRRYVDPDRSHTVIADSVPGS